MRLLAVLIEQYDDVHHDLGSLTTDDPDLGSLINRGLAVKLLRRHPEPVHPDQARLLVYSDEHRFARLWRVRALLPVQGFERLDEFEELWK